MLQRQMPKKEIKEDRIKHRMSINILSLLVYRNNMSYINGLELNSV